MEIKKPHSCGFFIFYYLRTNYSLPGFFRGAGLGRFGGADAERNLLS
jgi:hypothetical protein